MQGKCVSDAQVQALCLLLGLEITAAQKRRVARGYALFLAGAAQRANEEVTFYETWCCHSQEKPGDYVVRVFFEPIRATCDCPDFRQGYAATGLHAGPVCKHSIATLLTRHVQMQGSVLG